MDYKCNHCEAKFKTQSKTIEHLKKVHKIKENNERIHCIVDFQKADFCQKSYLTFNALKSHVKSCVKIKKKRDKMKVLIIIIIIK